MSQIYTSISSSPSVATSFETQDGTATPVGNVIVIEGESTNIDDDNSIRVIKGAAANEIIVQLTNINSAQIQTTDDTQTTIATIPLGALEGTYTIRNGYVTGYNLTDQLSCSYHFRGVARTDGASGVLVGGSAEPENSFVDTGMGACDIEVSIVGNDLIVQVTGLAAKTINWEMYFNYSFIGAVI